MFASNFYGNFQLLANNPNPFQNHGAFTRKQPPLIPMAPPPAADEAVEETSANNNNNNNNSQTHREPPQPPATPAMSDAQQQYINLLTTMEATRLEAARVVQSRMESMLDMPRLEMPMFDLASIEAQKLDLTRLEAKRRELTALETAIIEASRMKTLDSLNNTATTEKEDILEEIFSANDPIMMGKDTDDGPNLIEVSKNSKKIVATKGVAKLNRKIVKNFGKAIASFACSDKALGILEKSHRYRVSSRKRFINFVYDNKECIEGNRRFRQLLTVMDEDSEETVENKIIFKRIANIFMKSYVHQWIWNSKIMNKDLHAQLVSEMKKRIDNPILLESLSQ